MIATSAALIAVLLGTPFAYMMARYDFRFKEILDGKHDAVPEADFYMKGGINEVCPTH